MNNRGISILFTLMLGVVVLILAMALAGPLRQSLDITRNVTIGDTQGLDCLTGAGTKNTTISDFQQATCVSSDLLLPLFILSLIGIGGAVIGARLFLG
jgi:hypothetical protein